MRLGPQRRNRSKFAQDPSSRPSPLAGRGFGFMRDVTHILSQIASDDPTAAEKLLPHVYEELRKLAAAKLARESPGQTLQPTALVHEAYLRLVGSQQTSEWEGRGHFFAAAAEAMRRILVERARRRAAIKHGGQCQRLDLDEQLIVDDRRGEELLALDNALAELEQHDSQAAQLVKLRYFAGLSHQDAAEAMKITRRAADRLWLVAKAWLYNRLAVR
jgi:RNA polymerase sigma factor (TIGR02999 family)